MRPASVPLVLSWAVALAACPSSPGTLPDLDTAGPAVVLTSPSSNDTWADAHGTVTITFSEPVDPATVTTSSVVVTNGETRISGTISASGTACTFVPHPGFGYGLAYDVVVSTAVKDLAGNSLAAPYQFRFTTRSASAYRPTGLTLVSPPERGTDVDPNTNISASFMDEIDAATVTRSTFSVAQGGQPVAGLLSYEATSRMIRFTPEQELGIGLDYVVTLGAGLRSPGGKAPLPQGFAWSFTIRRLAGSVTVFDATTSGTGPLIDADSGGDVMVAWLQWDGTPPTVYGGHFDVFATRRDAGAWGAPELVGDIGPGTAELLRLRCASSGACLAVWRNYDPGYSRVSRIWANHYVPGTGWGTPVAIDGDEAYEEGLDLAAAPDGTAIAVWIGIGGLVANRFVPGEGWEGAVSIAGGGLQQPRIAMNASGDAVVTWVVYGTSWDVYAARYVRGSGWATAEVIEADAENAFYYPNVAIDSGGNAIVVWSQGGGTRWNRFVAGEGWGAAREVSTASGPIYSIGVDEAGRALIAFGATDPAMPWSAAFDPASGWGATTQLASCVDDEWYVPLVVAPSGDGAVAWKGPPQSFGTYRYIWMRRYTPETGWQTPVAVAALGALESNGPLQVARAGTGEVLAAWSDEQHVRVGSLP